MGKNFSSLRRQSFIFALAMTFGLAGVPFLALPGASFLGKDISQLAAGVVTYYPWSAVVEVVRVIAVAFTLAFCGAWTFAAAARHLKAGRWLVFPMLPLLVYTAWLCGTLLKYPALFGSNLPTSVQRLVFRTSFWLSPSWLFAFAVIVPVAALSVAVLSTLHKMQRRSLSLIVGAGVVILAAGSAFFLSPQSRCSR